MKMSFFQQERMDGGVRTGIDIDGEAVLQDFLPGRDYSDPALNWYVDVRVQGARLPTTAEGARQWFLEHAAVIRAGLRGLAGELRAGMDVDIWPLRRAVAGAPRGARIAIVCWAMQRLQALDIAHILRRISDRWEEEIRKLREEESASC